MRRLVIISFSVIIAIILLLSCEPLKREAKIVSGQITEVMATSASASGEIIDAGEGITDHGHCWGLAPGPDISGFTTSLGPTYVTDTFSSALRDLEPGVAYYARAFAMSDNRLVYGDDRMFITLDGIVQLATKVITNISVISAESGGTITSVNGDEVNARGVCWDTAANFILSSCINFTEDSLGLGTYTSELTGLLPATSYKVKAYAITSVDTFYGETLTFSTISGIVTITTEEATIITASSAASGGSITDVGGTTISARGVCWDSIVSPTIHDKKTTDGSGPGSYTSQLSGLQPNTTYYVRAYAINSLDTTYGQQVQLHTLDGIALLTTTQVSGINANSASSGGSISDDGGASITASGICWNTTGNPTTMDSKTTDGSQSGSYSSQLTGLDPNTSYYVRAYATTYFNTSYGDEVSFQTKGFPDVITSELSDLTNTSAVCGGDVTNDWGYSVTARGVCWNTTGSPTVESNEGYTVNGSDTGSFVSVLADLTTGSTYYVRAYATNSTGTAYGDEIPFDAIWTCGKSNVTDYEGNVYRTVQIGNQCWTRDNLKSTYYADASPLIDGSTAGNINGDYTTKYWFVYNDNPSLKEPYGLLYTWAAVMDGVASSDANPSGVQGVCPADWHLPSDSEWKELEMYLGMSQNQADTIYSRGTDEGGKLKEAGTANWESPNTGATNETGFTALPAGDRQEHGGYYSYYRFVIYWSSTEYNNVGAWVRQFSYVSSKVYRGFYSNKTMGYSVRCIKD